HRAVARRNLAEVVIPAGRVGGGDVLKASAWRREQVIERARGRRGLTARGQSDHEADPREAESHATPFPKSGQRCDAPHPVQETVTSKRGAASLRNDPPSHAG